jgi:hypothetical protein
MRRLGVLLRFLALAVSPDSIEKTQILATA